MRLCILSPRLDDAGLSVRASIPQGATVVTAFSRSLDGGRADRDRASLAILSAKPMKGPACPIPSISPADATVGTVRDPPDRADNRA